MMACYLLKGVENRNNPILSEPVATHTLLIMNALLPILMGVVTLIGVLLRAYREK